MEKTDVAQVVNEVNDEYDIEYGGFLSNHFVHGIVAVTGLGASKSRLDEFMSSYREHTVFGNSLEKRPQGCCDLLISRENYLEHASQRRHYCEYEAFFKKEVAGLGKVEALNRYFPPIMHVMSGAALHSLIHLGFGLDVADDVGIAAGLAYMYFTKPGLNLDVAPNEELVKEPVSSDPVSVLRAVHDAADVQPPSSLNFQTRLLNTPTARSRALARQWKEMWDEELESETHFTELYKELGTAIVSAFVSTGSKDFFLLHGVTGCYALWRIVNEGLDLKDKYAAARMLWEIVVHVYIAQGKPRLDLSLLEIPSTKNWSEIRSAALSDSNDEHYLKLVYVCEAFDTAFGGNDVWKLAASTCPPSFKRLFDSAVGWYAKVRWPLWSVIIGGIALWIFL